MKSSEWVDLGLRFVIGGTILVTVYLLASISPWKAFAGVFAAFPGVMASTVGLTGWRQNSKAAAEVAQGSVIGMLGGIVCVLATLAAVSLIKIWWISLVIGIFTWFAGSFLFHWVRKR